MKKILQKGHDYVFMALEIPTLPQLRMLPPSAKHRRNIAQTFNIGKLWTSKAFRFENSMLFQFLAHDSKHRIFHMELIVL